MRSAKTIAAVAALAWSALAPVCAQAQVEKQVEKPEVKLVLDWTWQGNHMFFTKAVEGGYFAKEGLTVTIDRGYGGGDTTTKVAAKAYDFGFADLNLLIKFNAENPGSRVISVMPIFDKSMVAMMGIKSKGVNAPKDIEGKTIVGSEGEVGRILLPLFARGTNLDLTKTKTLTVAPNLRDSLVAQGKGEATTGFASTVVFNLIAAGVKKDDIATFFYADYGLPMYGNSIIVREEFAKENPKTVQALLRALIAATKDAIKDPKAAMATLKKRDPLMNEELEMARYDYLMENTIYTADVKKNGFGHFDNDRLAKSIAGLSEAFSVANPPKPEEIATEKYLPAKEMRMP